MLLELKRTLGIERLAAALNRDDAKSTWVIDANRRGMRARAVEFWQYRRVLWFFATRMVTKRFQGTSLGMFWLFAQPVLPILISTFIFGRMLGMSAAVGIPYFLFFLGGTMIWALFERSLMWTTRSLDMNKGLIKKIYFPRLIIPVSSSTPAVVDVAVYGLLLLAASVYYLFKDDRWYLRVGPELGWAAFASLLAVLLAVAVGLWTTVWQVKYRDVRFGLRYVTRFWFYLTPVIYPVSQIPQEHRWLLYANPMAPIVETFKWGVLGVGDFYGWPLVSACAVIAVIMTGGVWYFSQSEALSVDKM